MRPFITIAPLALALALAAPPLRAADPDEKLYRAARKGNAAKVADFLERGVSLESELIALSVSAAANEPGTFALLWQRDHSEIAPGALDDALCYGHRNEEPVPEIREVLDQRGLTADACCARKRDQPYCARRPIRLTEASYPGTTCETLFTEESQLPPGATRVAVVWDERVSVLDPSASAKYGLPPLTPAGAADWAREFAEMLGALGADAMLIMSAERDTQSRSAVQRYPAGPSGAEASGFTFGTVTDRIEVVGIRTAP